MTATAVSQSVRGMLRDFIAGEMDEADEVDRQQLIDDAIARFADDADFQDALLRDAIPQLVPEILVAFVASRRQDVVMTSRGAVTRRKLELTARERLASVFEGTGHGYRSFLALKKADLLAANDRDSKEIATRQQWVALRADFAKRMDDTKTVGEAFTGQQLATALNKHFAPQ